MVKLYLIRHAEIEWNPIGRYQGLLDPELSERGARCYLYKAWTDT